MLRADLKELWDTDLEGKPYAYTPFCTSRCVDYSDFVLNSDDNSDDDDYDNENNNNHDYDYDDIDNDNYNIYDNDDGDNNDSDDENNSYDSNNNAFFSLIPGKRL